VSTRTGIEHEETLLSESAARETSLNSQIIETGEEMFIFRNCLVKLPGISLKKNYRVLTGSVYREPAELKIWHYFGLCYENISYHKSACD
jgi:hypothetical protein